MKFTPSPKPYARLLAWLPALALMAVIFVLSAQSDLPGPHDPLWNRILKKTLHALGYGLLALSYRHALHRGHGWRGAMASWGALGLTLLYAISDEWHQSFVPNRTGQPLDVLVDLCGAVALLVGQRLRDGPQDDLTPER